MKTNVYALEAITQLHQAVLSDSHRLYFFFVAINNFSLNRCLKKFYNCLKKRKISVSHEKEKRKLMQRRKYDENLLNCLNSEPRLIVRI